MISQGIILVLLSVIICTNAHDTHAPLSVKNSLKCYSCFYVEGNGNITNPGCELAIPPKQYQTTECFAYGNLKISSGLHHQHMTNISHNDGPHIAHCSIISGTTDTGAKVIMRGCESRNETLRDKTCYDDSNFPLFGIGTLQNVKKCYCTKEVCNSSNYPGVSYIGLFTGIFTTAVWSLYK